MMLGLKGSITLRLMGAELTCDGEDFSWEEGGDDDVYLFVYDEDDERVEMTLEIRNDIIIKILRVTWNWELVEDYEHNLKVTYR
ncbi:hypothetical protein QT231_22955 [Halomonas sp. SpR1]|uniref:hypothetical protein n=1 Tax=Halomonas sp. SpR1 TaxID=3050462 RepID=UPI0027E55D8D|nr:hypothetical protein [Halomonas sp. SpR1]MDQ7735570.1 hypothetical protein [Halomonas sp. SpR1]